MDLYACLTNTLEKYISTFSDKKCNDKKTKSILNKIK